MVDLHVHTMSSDGTDDAVSILKKAQNRNLKYLSITDHDNCEMYNKFKNMNISNYYTGKIVPGVELRTIINGVPIELLGYGVDTDYINSKVSKLYQSCEDKDIIEMKRLYNNFLDLGVEIEPDVLDNYDGSFRYGSSYLYSKLRKNINNKRFILDDRIWQDDNLFYRRCIANPKSPFYVKSDDLIPSCQEVINLVKDAGGLVFIPHIFIYGDNTKMIFENLVTNYPIDGIECFYSHFTDEETQKMVAYCKENQLYMSGGSDYHGENKPELELGIGKGNLNIETNIVENWITKLVSIS